MTHLSALGVLVFLVAPSQDPLVARVRQTAYARMELASGVAHDAAVMGFVQAKNDQQETPAEIQKRDGRWKAGGETELRKETTTGPCADRLRALTKGDPFVLEAFLMDAQGALVCATHETSDYWQGDEAKWQKTYRDGTQVFVDDPALDPSTGTFAVQLSRIVADAHGKIGALTLTLKVPRSSLAR